MKRTPLARSTKAIPARSRKMHALYAGPAGRRAFRVYMLNMYPACMFELYAKRCTRAAVDVHEVLSRARGGAILPTEKAIAQGQRFVTVCRIDHGIITDFPGLADSYGWSISKGGSSTRGIAAADLTNWAER